MRDFTGFRFGLVHSEDLHLVVVSSSNRYVKETQPGIKDYTTEVPGGNGSYLFGQTFSTQEFTINVAFEEVDENTWRKISQLFSTDKPQDLVFDELPYKTYRAKLKQKPSFKTLCFTDDETRKRIYKGEGTLNFICYYPFAFGFNKYIVRAADYYNFYTPEQIINGEADFAKIKGKNLNNRMREYYNVDANMATPWQGGYPSTEQVACGELFFKNPVTGEKEMIDVDKYFSNIPEWQDSAQLLFSPTLDQDQELIYMPQYSKTNYYNMDMGLNRQNGVIGSRILVYNPGDIPIDFELKLGHLVSKYRAMIRDGAIYRFRINRYNVQRLTIEQAVDWCDLKTYNRDDEEDYKYGSRYFTMLKTENPSGVLWSDYIQHHDDWSYDIKNIKLGKRHPHHAYYVEPIPREKLGYFIRLFYWQSCHLKDEEGYTQRAMKYEDGIMMADRYEELYNLCITEEEKYELYWKTLKEAILDKYNEVNKSIAFGDGVLNDDKVNFFDDPDLNDLFPECNYTYEDFVQDYLYSPPEYVSEDEDKLNYGEFDFNISRYPGYYTYDYMELNSKNFEKILLGDCGCDHVFTNSSNEKEVNSSAIRPLQLDFSKRIVYNENKPEWDYEKEWQDNPANAIKLKNFYHFSQERKLFNDNIQKGSWFKIPPGWSMIEIVPVVDEILWNGKRWLDARPFIWGQTEEVFKSHFDKVYYQAAIDFLAQEKPVYLFNTLLPDINHYREIDNKSIVNIQNKDTAEKIKEELSKLDLYEIEQLMQFRRWHSDYMPTYEEEEDGRIVTKDYPKRVGMKYYPYWQSAKDNSYPYNERIENHEGILALGYEIQYKRNDAIEKRFLHKLDDYWRANTPDINGQPAGSIDDWWWFANSYIWANFPPTYWGYADLLNNAQIKYTPLFY